MLLALSFDARELRQMEADSDQSRVERIHSLRLCHELSESLLLLAAEQSCDSKPAAKTIAYYCRVRLVVPALAQLDDDDDVDDVGDFRRK